ncbi:Cyclic nucleotide-binding protein [Pseudocohnilembus persalinus]|uniref:Cyclic nucleotide-binding protein n=1 Tax=Pseudocohnilembus persalinus TaxID=266149 RepID=A0A0V0R6C5_PSEPJ|nr:Cyclic nucleotide-binding protein [Pseudocohnilembus persalinus]|eukprot:KRX09898.1 Cyclic nucleotide-binding protein [Pseudocohnilembus persalinus]
MYNLDKYPQTLPLQLKINKANEQQKNGEQQNKFFEQKSPNNIPMIQNPQDMTFQILSQVAKKVQIQKQRIKRKTKLFDVVENNGEVQPKDLQQEKQINKENQQYNLCKQEIRKMSYSFLNDDEVKKRELEFLLEEENLDLLNKNVSYMACQILMKNQKSDQEIQFLIKIVKQLNVFKENPHLLGNISYGLMQRSFKLNFFKKNQVIFNKGEIGDNFYIVLRGKVITLIPSNKQKITTFKEVLNGMSMQSNNKKMIFFTNKFNYQTILKVKNNKNDKEQQQQLFESQKNQEIKDQNLGLVQKIQIENDLTQNESMFQSQINNAASKIINQKILNLNTYKSPIDLGKSQEKKKKYFVNENIDNFKYTDEVMSDRNLSMKKLQNQVKNKTVQINLQSQQQKEENEQILQINNEDDYEQKLDQSYNFSGSDQQEMQQSSQNSYIDNNLQVSQIDTEQYLNMYFQDWENVKDFCAGEGFGDFALLNRQQSERTATMVAKEDTFCMSISKQAFERMMEEYKEKVVNEKLRFFRKFQFFKEVPENYLLQMIKNNEIQKLDLGYSQCKISNNDNQNYENDKNHNNVCVYKEGDFADKIFFIKKGKVQISVSKRSKRNLYQEDFVQDINLYEFQQEENKGDNFIEQKANGQIQNNKQQQEDGLKMQKCMEQKISQLKMGKMMNLKNKNSDKNTDFLKIKVLDADDYFGEDEVLFQQKLRKFKATVISYEAEIYSFDANEFLIYSEQMQDQMNNLEKIRDQRYPDAINTKNELQFNTLL